LEHVQKKEIIRRKATYFMEIVFFLRKMADYYFIKTGIRITAKQKKSEFLVIFF